jgi:F-type H+-transporting ATPase subunit delta
MTNRTAARRYARALLDVAIKEGVDPQQVERDLEAFADLLRQHPPLERTLTNPAVAANRKRAIASEVLSRTALTPTVSKLLVLLADRDRFVMYGEIVEAYRDLLREHQNIVQAEVTTAVPLGDDRLRSMEGRLAQSTGKRVSIVTKVDPDILGGLVTRIGSVVYDASVAGQLARLREQLGGGAAGGA